MKPRVLFAAALSFALPLSIAVAGDSCPQTSPAWTIFPDSTPGAPDFWWKTDPVDVRAICLCEHGVQFQFDVKEKGERRRAALVFPKPTRALLADRLRPKLKGAALDAEVEHCRRRYESLLAALERMSAGSLRGDACLRFEPGGEIEPPTIIVAMRLTLYWMGEELKLRGYLDVYFRSVPVVAHTAEIEDGVTLAESGGVPEGVSLAPGIEPLPDAQLRIVPNPGGRKLPGLFRSSGAGTSGAGRVQRRGETGRNTDVGLGAGRRPAADLERSDFRRPEDQQRRLLRAADHDPGGAGREVRARRTLARRREFPWARRARNRRRRAMPEAVLPAATVSGTGP